MSIINKIKFNIDSPISSRFSHNYKLLFKGWVVNLESGNPVNVRILDGKVSYNLKKVSRPDVCSYFGFNTEESIRPGFDYEYLVPFGMRRIKLQFEISNNTWHTFFVINVFSTRNLNKLYSNFKLFISNDVSAPTLCNFRFHVDYPIKKFYAINHNFIIRGWALDLNSKLPANLRIVVGRDIFQVEKTERKDASSQFCGYELPTNCGFMGYLRLKNGFNIVAVEIHDNESNWIPITRVLVFSLANSNKLYSNLYSEYSKYNFDNTNQFKSIAEQHIDVMKFKPWFHLVITDEGRGLLEKTVDSIKSQIYSGYTIITHDIKSAYNSNYFNDLYKLLATSDEVLDFIPRFVIVIREGNVLTKDALYQFASVINSGSVPNVIYADNEVTLNNGKILPFFKPDWSPDYLESFNYIGFPACFNLKLFSSPCAYRNYYDLVLQCCLEASNIVHISKILGRVACCIGTVDPSDDIIALEKRLSQTNRSGAVSVLAPNLECYSIKPSLHTNPLISIIIPTAGKTVNIDGIKKDLICNIVSQISNLSTYKLFEIIVVDNGDLTASQITSLNNYGCKLVTFRDNVFNISKKINLGFRHAIGDLILLLNDDLEILEPSWLEYMACHFEKQHVGVVGAKLLYTNGNIQHAGVVNIHGNPDHVRRGYPSDDLGYFYSTAAVRNFSAVTGAVMMVKASTFEAVGGYTEKLAVSYNDSDFCMKVRMLGKTVVYDPTVVLTHFESVSRVAYLDNDESEYYHNRWDPIEPFDAYYNVNFLSITPPNYTISVNQRLM